MLPDGEYHPLPEGSKRKAYDSRGVLRYHFDGMIEAVEQAKSGPHRDFEGGVYGNQSHDSLPSYRWDFALGWDGAVAMAYEGWPEGRENIEALASSIREEIERTSIVSYMRPQIVSGVAGSMVNVPAYIAGVPEAMYEWCEEETDSPVIEITVESCASAGISSEYYSTRGSAVVALIDMLEAAGRRCEVTYIDTMVVGYAEAECQHVADVRTTLKRPGDALQIDSLAFAIAHPAYFRRIGFALIENLPKKQAEAQVHNSYGYPTDTAFERGDVHIPAMSSMDKEWANNEGARAWVINHLKEHGVVIS